MEFCLDERGRIVQKVHYARRKTFASSSKPPASSKASIQPRTSTNEMDDNLDNATDEAEYDFPLDPAGRVSIAATNGSIAKGGVPVPFPWRLHDMLDAMEQQGKDDIVTWQPHGLAFLVKDPKAFVEQIMPHYFSQSKYASFQRQLNLYGFSRLGHGRDKGAYYHGCFIKGNRDLVRNMIRKKVKGTMVRKSFGPEQEPNFYDSQWVLQQEQEQPTNSQQMESAGQFPTHLRVSPLASDSGSTTTSSSVSSQCVQNNVHQLEMPGPKLHGFTTHIDPRLTLVVPPHLLKKKNEPSSQDNLSKSFSLKAEVLETSCPLSRLAAVAGHFDDVTR